MLLDELLYLLSVFFIALTQTLQVFVNLSNLINIFSLLKHTVITDTYNMVDTTRTEIKMQIKLP